MTAGVVAPGKADRGLPRSVWDNHRDLAVELLTIGRHPRAGYAHRRPWAGIDWTQYAASVPLGGRSGPWRVGMVEVTDDSPTAAVAHAEGMPHRAGWYTELRHDLRGLVMSDVPTEIAGALDFLDRAHGRVLIAGLGLGVVPAWLLRHADVERVDVVELDPHVIKVVAGDPEPDWWQADPRLHLHHADAHTWTPPPGVRWHCAWFDIWDTISHHNLPSMRHLQRRYRSRVGWAMCWERAECVNLVRLGATVERPGCSLPEWV
jgi:hypothetical protein